MNNLVTRKGRVSVTAEVRENKHRRHRRRKYHLQYFQQGSGRKKTP